MSEPEMKEDHLYHLLREGKIDDFNHACAKGESPDLINADMRGLGLQGLHADGLDFQGGYFRQADLRGIDFSKANLNGASIHAAKISGCLFPAELSADEITLSLIHGTRMRYGC
ncbi:pentapeptide repeat-containing protein [Sulfuriflexus sp.]|uniref:pentapeptide repeat-containing protein n=1 Tax=Sulfuriflexus sp. TaxID=2015443 RepID=UPI0028CC72A8|nr:pentapeptide repeat-containing protein [Sulfuriflexus sp.]MDT8403684.1 pentapeptide repeat-containing protein [Sulfuriflexus sp.]